MNRIHMIIKMNRMCGAPHCLGIAAKTGLQYARDERASERNVLLFRCKTANYHLLTWVMHHVIRYT